MPRPESTLSPEEYALGSNRYRDVYDRVAPRLTNELAAKDLTLGSAVFIRIFKRNRELELWVGNPQDDSFKLFKTYRIAAMSGVLGPKLAEGDLQAPEGFYFITPSQLNPQSSFHLSFNIGYPNTYDRAHDRTGTNIMVHGNRVSVGCFAMTDYYIEEIYTLCASAMENGQPFIRIHCLPFPLTDELLAPLADHKWHDFWKMLQPGYAHFETHHTPPNIKVSQGRYLIE